MAFDGVDMRHIGATRWTAAEREQVAALRAQGLGRSEIAQVMGKSKWAVRSYLARHKDGRIVLRPWTSEEDALIRGRSPGSTYADIAALMPDRTAGAVRYRARRLGVANTLRKPALADVADWETGWPVLVGSPVARDAAFVRSLVQSALAAGLLKAPRS